MNNIIQCNNGVLQVKEHFSSEYLLCKRIAVLKQKGLTGFNVVSYSEHDYKLGYKIPLDRINEFC